MFKLIGLLISFASLALLALLTRAPLLYVDPVALVVMFGTVFGGTIYTYGNQSFHFFSLSYKDKISTAQMFPALEFYNYLTKLTIIAALISVGVSTLVILFTIGGGGDIKASLQLALLTCLYGIVLSFLIIQPIKHNILFKATSYQKRHKVKKA
jgi:flagellar motor component MotA